MTDKDRVVIVRALVGAAAGGILGLLAGTIWFGLSTDSPQSGLVGVFVGGPAGALIGATLGAGWDVSTSERNQLPSINTASVAVAGLPGLILFIVVIAIALAFPAIKWILVASVVAGVLLGTALIVRRR